jgi:membrane protein
MAKSVKGTMSRAWAGVTGTLRLVAAHDLPRHAAALTYYLVLAVFPILVVVIAILGLVGLSPEALQSLLDAVADLGSGWPVQFVSAVLNSILTASGTPLLLSVGVVLALWTTSGYVRAFMWAAGDISGKPETRGWLRGLAVRLGLALLIAVLLAAASVVVVFAGPFAEWLGQLLGIGEAAVQFWTVAEWPFFFAFAVAVYMLVYRAAPQSGARRLRHDLIGSCCGVVVWLIASALFSFYLTNFGSYDRVYGALGAAIALLVWAWILDLTLLAGLEVSLALGRRRGSTGDDG